MNVRKPAALIFGVLYAGVVLWMIVTETKRDFWFWLQAIGRLGFGAGIMWWILEVKKE
jgi:hypothetical protein